MQQLADDAASLGAEVGAVIDGAEHYLVATAAVNGVHVVDECLHSLVNTACSAIDGMLEHTLTTLEIVKWTDDVVVNLGVV